jgi:hypothetical protein
MAPAVPTPRSDHAPRAALRAPIAAAAILGALAAGCGPSSPEPAVPAASTQPAASVAPSATAAPGDAAAAATTAAPSSSATAAAPPAKRGVPYDSVPSPGTNPLSDAEASELKTKCKKFTDAITAAAKKAGSGKRPIDGMFEALANAPKVAGVDVPRCSELMKRELIAYFAATRENEAKINLRRIIVGLMSKLEQDGHALCPSAAAVPAALASVKDQPYASTAADWSTAGWKCAVFDLSGGQQVFQYELVTDPKAMTYEVIARGYAVQGGPPTELYIAGKVESGVIDPSTPILRR